MKKGIKVTPQNITMVFGHIKKLLKGKEYLTVRNVYAKGSKLNRELNLHGKKEGPFPLKEETVLSKRSLQRIASITLTDTYIAVRDSEGIGSIINVGDTVKISANMVKIEPPINILDPSPRTRIWSLEKLPHRRTMFDWRNMTVIQTDSAVRSAISDLLRYGSKEDAVEGLCEEYGYPGGRPSLSVYHGPGGRSFMGNVFYVGNKEYEKWGEVITFTGYM